jgi:hypothetical protein
MTAQLLASRSLTAVALLIVHGATLSWAAPAHTVSRNGPPANRIDIAVLGDGYTSAEMGTYADDVRRTVLALFGQEPFHGYRTYFNVHRVDVVSAESGSDHPASGVFRDTALDSFYDCAGITRLICVDYGKVYDVLLSSLDADRRDVVLVLVNDPEYGGSGGAIAVASLDPSVVEVVLHELGHTLGGLADEYDYEPPFCYLDAEPFEPNVTLDYDRSRIKWAHWIDDTTPLPTMDFAPGVPGAYEGAQYCVSGKFRPTYASKMRELYQPFEQINTEQLILRMYGTVSPIDRTGARRVGRSPIWEFFVATPTPASHRLRVRWDVDGRALSSDAMVRLNLQRLPPGRHRVRVTVWDATTLVRSDPERILRDSRSWIVDGKQTPRRDHAVALLQR